MSDKALAIREDMSLSEIGNVFVKSGFFADTRDASQAIVKILAGREFGFGPFSSMTGVYIIQGRPSLAANLMAAAVKRSGRYDYRVREMTDQVCDVEYFERGDKPESLGHSRFTLDDAKKAGTKNLDKYPRNMLFARAMSNGVKWFCPDVFNGSAVYTPDELGADVDEEGRAINIETIPDARPVIVTETGEIVNGKLPAPAPIVMTLDEARNLKTDKGTEFGMLNHDQLQMIVDKSKDAHRVRAAQMILAGWKMAEEAQDEAARQAANE
jgi:hypothetical protein